jgi:flagellar basal-body rod modification protein FlgD
MTSPVGNTGYTPISSVLPSTNGASGTGKTDKTQLDKDAFLKLLVAQLKYQDPSSPADPSQFMAQTAQFTMVEKLTDLATGQADLLAAQLKLSAAGMVGRTVTFDGADGAPVSGVVTAATISGSNPTVRVGNMDVPLSSVRDVRTSSTGS